MLLKILRQLFRDVLVKITGSNRFVIVCATRLSEVDFWADSSMGKSIGEIKKQIPNQSCKISFENTLGLPQIYNSAIRSAKWRDVLIFVHDDVWLEAETFYVELAKALEKYQVVGVAGNTRLVAAHPGWAFKEIRDGNFVWDHPYLSGAVWHGRPGTPESLPSVSNYGLVPAHCELVDGVFIAARALDLKLKRTYFDERFDFHFYDLDFCRTIRQAGLSLGTWEIPLIHESGGQFGGNSWKTAYRKYLSKWKN